MNNLQLTDVTKQFGNFKAVENLTFSAQSGRILGLLGPNGAGKTTTIRMIAGITIPDSGTISFNGQPVGPETQNRMGYLPEERGLYKKMKVLDGIQFLGEIKNMPAKIAREKGMQLLEKFGLSEWAIKKIDELSKGMQQKVQILSTIIHDPDFVILDEPLSGLDPINAELVNDVILQLKQDGKIILFSTHRMEQVEKICDDIVLIHKGQSVLQGTLREIKQQHGKDTVKIDFDGETDVFQSINGISLVEVNPKHAELRLQTITMKELITAINPHIQIERIERTEPSLKDIFIQTVTARGDQLEEELK